MNVNSLTPSTFRHLGSFPPAIFPLSLGCMGMSGVYGPSDEAESIATIHAALDSGVNLLDTGDFYGMGHNEMLIGRALKGRREEALLSVKFGALRGPDNSWGGFDGRPAAVKNFLAYTLNRLGVDHIDIYRPARLDPNVPIEDTIGAIADLIKAGYVRAIGLSEVGPETIRRAAAVHPIADLQIEYALVSRGPEATIFPVLRELGIGVVVTDHHTPRADGVLPDAPIVHPRLGGGNPCGDLCAAAHVAWVKGDEVGLTFYRPIPPEDLATN